MAGYVDGATSVSLVPLNGAAGWLISDTQILVSNDVDDDFPLAAAANPNWPGNPVPVPKAGGIGGDDEPADHTATKNRKRMGDGEYNFPVGDRTHIVALGGQVKVKYGNLEDVQDVKVKRTVLVHVNIMRTGTDGPPAVAEAAVLQDMKVAREVYAQVGLDMRFSDLPIQVTPPPHETWRMPPNGPEVSNPPAGANLHTPGDRPSLETAGMDEVPGPPGTTNQGRMWHQITSEEAALLGTVRLRTTTVVYRKDVEVYYVLRASGGEAGGAYLRNFLRPENQNLADSVVMATKVMDDGGETERPLPTILAHEVMHVLENAPNYADTHDTTHYPYYDDVPRGPERTNLMVTGSAMIRGGEGFVLSDEGLMQPRDDGSGKHKVFQTGSGVFDSRRLTRQQERGFTFKYGTATIVLPGLLNGRPEMLTT